MLLNRNELNPLLNKSVLSINGFSVKPNRLAVRVSNHGYYIPNHPAEVFPARKKRKPLGEWNTAPRKIQQSPRPDMAARASSQPFQHWPWAFSGFFLNTASFTSNTTYTHTHVLPPAPTIELVEFRNDFHIPCFDRESRKNRAWFNEFRTIAVNEAIPGWVFRLLGYQVLFDGGINEINSGYWIIFNKCYINNITGGQIYIYNSRELSSKDLPLNINSITGPAKIFVFGNTKLQVHNLIGETDLGRLANYVGCKKPNNPQPLQLHFYERSSLWTPFICQFGLHDYLSSFHILLTFHNHSLLQTGQISHGKIIFYDQSRYTFTLAGTDAEVHIVLGKQPSSTPQIFQKNTNPKNNKRQPLKLVNGSIFLDTGSNNTSDLEPSKLVYAEKYARKLHKYITTTPSRVQIHII